MAIRLRCFLCLILALLVAQRAQPQTPPKDTSLQLAGNPAMKLVTHAPPPLPEVSEEFEIRQGFRLVSTLDKFREATQSNGNKIRMKPGVYRAKRLARPQKGQEHIFSVNGSNNRFDLRGVVIETPVSLQSQLTGRAHVADTWHINGSGNTFEGAYFRNVVDRRYPHFRVTENEFEIHGNDNTFLNCTFVIKGSIPFGYSDYFGDGGPSFGRINKHSFMSIERARNTQLIGCTTYMKSFGHGVQLHGVDGVLIKDCRFSGVLRPTNDILKEYLGRAKEYQFHIKYPAKRPIPKDQIIALTADGICSIGRSKSVEVVNTVIERMRTGVRLWCDGDVKLENVTVLESGDFSFDVSSSTRGRVVMKDCRSDLAYHPVFGLTHANVPERSFYEVTILNDADDGSVAPRPKNLGTVCGINCTFILRDGTSHPVPPISNRLICGGNQPLVRSIVANYTNATLILTKQVQRCVIKSVGPVEDGGRENTIIKIKKSEVQ